MIFKSLSLRVLVFLVSIFITIFVTPQSGQAFDHECHYAWTYYLALHVGYSPRQAYQIASAAFAIDEDKDTGPMEATAGDVVYGGNHAGLFGLKQPHPKISGIWRRFHAFSLEGEKGTQVTATKKADQDYLWDLAIKQKNPGPLIHYTQDIYSHSGWDNYNGHAMAGHKPDFLASNPSYSELMTYDTIRVLQEFRKRAFPGRDWVKDIREPDIARMIEVLKRLYVANPAPWQLSPDQYVPIGEVGRPDLVPVIQVLNAAIKEDQVSGLLPSFGKDLEDRSSAQLPNSILIPPKWHEFDYDSEGHVQAPALRGYSVELPRIFVSAVVPQISASETYTTLDGSTIQIKLPYEIEGIFEHEPLGEITVAIKEYGGVDPGNAEISKLTGYFHTVEVKNGKYEINGSFGVQNKDLLKGPVWICGLQIDGLKPIVTKVVVPCDQNVMDKWIGQIYDEAMAISGGRACSVLEDAAAKIKEVLENSACPRAFEAQAKLTSLTNKIEASKNAAQQLETSVQSARGAIAKCDAKAATGMIATARQALSEIACQPSEGSVLNENSIADLEYDRNSMQRDQQEFLKKITELSTNAEDAALRCDEIDAQSAKTKMETEIAAYTEKCPSTPELFETSTRVQELLANFKNQEPGKAAIQEGKDSLKACDVLGAQAAADQLEFIGKSCGIDGPLEAQNIRTAADSIARMQEALIQNVAALRDKARNGWNGACDFAAVRAAHSEIFRITEPFSTKCPEYPAGIEADVSEVEKIFESAEQQVVAEREITDLYQQAKTAWHQCKPAEVKQIIDDLWKVQRPNPHCTSLSQQAGPFYADALKFSSAGQQMINSIEAADQLLQSCPSDSKPIEQELKKAEMQIAEIQKSQMSCDLREPLTVIAQIRKDAADVESSRKNIAGKLTTAMNLFNQGRTDEGRNLRNEASQLLTNASPQECFEDLSASLDNLDFLTDAEEQGEDPFGGVEELPEDDPELPEDDPIDLVEIPEDGEDPVGQNKGTTVSFTGTWESSYGTLTLSQGGNSVSGSSDYYSTQVNGTIKEDGKLHFTWSDSNNKKGVGVFELSSDGQSFSGSWSYLLSDGKTLGNGGTWGGRRIN